MYPLGKANKIQEEKDESDITEEDFSEALQYEMISKGELPTIRIGRAVRISTSALRKWVEEREQQEGLTA